MRGFIARPREVDFTRLETTPSSWALPIKRICFFSLIRAFFGFVGVLVRTSKDFGRLDFGASFCFYACNYSFSLSLTSSILSSLTIAYRAFATFSASFLALFSACVTFLASMRVRSDFSNASFSASLACASRTLATEKYIGFVCSSPKTFSLFPRTLLFFSSFKALINPSFMY